MDVFISYSNHDEYFAKEIAEKLEAKKPETYFI